MFGITALILMIVLNMIISIQNAWGKDYPHALMYFSYAVATSALLWYELIKLKGCI